MAGAGLAARLPGAQLSCFSPGQCRAAGPPSNAGTEVPESGRVGIPTPPFPVQAVTVSRPAPHAAATLKHQPGVPVGQKRAGRRAAGSREQRGCFFFKPFTSQACREALRFCCSGACGALRRAAAPYFLPRKPPPVAAILGRASCRTPHALGAVPLPFPCLLALTAFLGARAPIRRFGGELLTLEAPATGSNSTAEGRREIARGP